MWIRRILSDPGLLFCETVAGYPLGTKAVRHPSYSIQLYLLNQMVVLKKLKNWQDREGEVDGGEKRGRWVGGIPEELFHEYIYTSSDIIRLSR